MVVGKVVLLSSIIILLMAVIAFHYRNSLDSGNFVEKEKYNLIIGILSARENFKQREALRRTWVKVLNRGISRTNEKKILHKFIIGSNACEVPIEDRIDAYTCSWDPYIEKNEDEIIAYRVRSDSEIKRWMKPIGLDFEVIHPVIITKLGIPIFNSMTTFQAPIKVSIFDRMSKTEILSASLEKKGTNVFDGFLFQTVENYLLPKEFKGTMVVDGNGKEFLAAQSNRSCLINDGNGLIRFKKLTRHSILNGFFPTEVHESDSYCSMVGSTFVYRHYGREILQPGKSVSSVKAKLERWHAWQEKLKKEKYLLENEKIFNQDVLFVNVEDVYRNIPLKLLKFYDWVHHQYDFNFTLKTDDDCYLNIPKIFQMLDSKIQIASGSFWIGNFRFNWPLDRFGKWAEHDYTSPVYPAFACGSGYILSANIVKWISMNSDFLHSYQGEDVSTGIWLSAINPKMINDKRWSCFKICDKEMLSLPNNEPKELFSLYYNQTSCQNPCECTV